MSKNIYGDQDAIRIAMESKPGDKSVYVNWEAINELPDEFESTISKVKYDPANLKKSFSPVGNNNYMPSPEMMYEIADKCGISGGDKSISEPLIEMIDINPMLMKSLVEEPTFRKMIVGRKVVKYSTKIQEDGTLLRSSPCTSEYNVWERCKLDWSKEELDSDGYQNITTGSYEYFGKSVYGDYYTKGKYKYPVKYNTTLKRQHHFDSEMKFAHAKAETKANLKAIRELASLVTGFHESELKTGYLIFAKIRRSRKVMKMETAARLTAISHGQQPGSAESDLLFDATPEALPEPTITAAEEDTPPPPEKTATERMIFSLEYYRSNDLIPKDLLKTTKDLQDWLSSNPKAEQHATFWPKAITFLKSVEDVLPQETRFTHNLY